MTVEGVFVMGRVVSALPAAGAMQRIDLRSQVQQAHIPIASFCLRYTAPLPACAGWQPPGDRAMIETVTTVTPELMDALARLRPQLSDMPLPQRAHLAEMLADPHTRLFVARDEAGAIVGMLTLVVYRIPTGTHAVIEDVVVDADQRGQGFGAALTRMALDEAVRMGAGVVDLTSRPSRTAANRLYRRLGFTQRETNAYRYMINPAGEHGRGGDLGVE
jgi:ribosomal protein S18 acetylase RimI-like enzyme